MNVLYADKRGRYDTMTTKTEFNGEEAYQCDECRMHYKNQKTAEKCEEYCRENSMCNSEITAKSMERNNSK